MGMLCNFKNSILFSKSHKTYKKKKSEKLLPIEIVRRFIKNIKSLENFLQNIFKNITKNLQTYSKECIHQWSKIINYSFIQYIDIM